MPDSLSEDRPRAAYYVPRVLVDLTTTLGRIDEPPVGITRVETRLASALLICDDLVTVPVVFKHPGTLSALSMETALELLDHSTRQPDFPLVLERRTGAQIIADDRLPRTKPGKKKPFNARAAARVFVRQPGKLLRREKTLAEMMELYDPPDGIEIKPKSLKDEVWKNLTTRVLPTQSDIFWTAGLLSHFVRPRDLHVLKNRTGMRVSSVLYDIIRVLYPEYNSKNLSADLHDLNVADMLKLSDYPFAISNWSRSTIEEFARKRQIEHAPIELQAMGVDLPVKKISEEAKAALADLLGDCPFALSVGSIEPRKNIETLLSAWDIMGAHAADAPTLLIVGRPGYGHEDLVAHVKAHPMFESKVLWLSGCSDAALDYLYDHATVVLCPSFAEGWGLPVIEALAHGCTVVASDVTAHPEAAGAAAVLLPPDAPQAWAAAIEEAFAGSGSGKSRARLCKIPTWDEAGETLCDALKRHLHSPAGKK